MITADAGGSNSPRTRLWKWELQRFANRTGLTITVCHYPPGTSKWNRIEHRLFSYIAMNWRGTAAGQLGHRGQSDRRHDDGERPAGALGDRHTLVPARGEGDGRTNAAHQSVTA